VDRERGSAIGLLKRAAQRQPAEAQQARCAFADMPRLARGYAAAPA